jgi:hypothetical protein
MRRGFLSFCVLTVWRGRTPTPGSYYDIIAASVPSTSLCNAKLEIQKNSPGLSEKPGLLGFDSNQARLFNVTIVTVS